MKLRPSRKLTGPASPQCCSSLWLVKGTHNTETGMNTGLFIITSVRATAHCGGRCWVLAHRFVSAMILVSGVKAGYGLMPGDTAVCASISTYKSDTPPSGQR